jgi:type IV secretion system protein VirB6
MPTQSTIFVDMFSKVDDSVVAVLSTKTTNLISLITPLIAAGFGLYLLLIALSYLRDQAPLDGMFVDLLKRFFAWGVIITFALNVGSYISVVVPLVMNIPNELSQSLSNDPTAVNAAATSLDGLMDQYNQIIDTIQKHSAGLDTLDFSGEMADMFQMFAIIVFAEPFLLIAAAFILLAKIFTAVLLCVGPLFIALALFPATRKYFEAWVGQVVTYMFLSVLYSVVAMLEIQIMQQVMIQPHPSTTTAGAVGYALSDIIYMCSFGIVFLIVALKIPDLAAGLGGGIAAGGYGEAGRIVKQMSGGGKGKNGGGGGNKGGTDKKGGGSIKPESQGV